MEKTLKIKLSQNRAVYLSSEFRDPNVIESDILPSPSNIRGMCHSILNLKQYHPLKISIRGYHEGLKEYQIQQVNKFVRDRKESAHLQEVRCAGSKKRLQRSIRMVRAVNDIELILHISFEDNSLNKELKDAIQAGVVTLGRNEDIARVDDVTFVDVIEEKKSFTLKTNEYMYAAHTENKNLIVLPFYYLPVSKMTDKRVFRRIKASLYTAGQNIISYYDTDNEPVSFLSESMRIGVI